MPGKKNPLPAPNSCKCCHKSHLKLSTCSRCKDAFYCSVDCQKKDWVNHKKACKPKTSEQQSPVPPLPNKESCNHCGISGVKLSTCSRCHEAKYCSKECQKAEWTKHKVDCKKNSDLSAISHFLSGTSEMFRKFPDRVCLIAKRRYPEFQLVTKFVNIGDFNPFEFSSDMQVLLVLMLKFGDHPFRPSMMVRDENGTEDLHLIFYLDDYGQDLNFPWEKFQPGKYICIMYPQIHIFLSGIVGFRVESTKDVSFIECF